MSCRKGIYLVRGQKGRFLSTTWGLSEHVPVLYYVIKKTLQNVKSFCNRCSVPRHFAGSKSSVTSYNS